MKMKRIMGFFLALVMFMGCLPLNPIASYANGDVKIDKTNFEDENFKNYVKKNFDTDKNGYLSQDELDKVEKIFIVETRDLSSLKGIEHFKNLTILSCYINNLKSLDVSKNTKLTELHCNDNKLTSLDLSKNTNLTILSCGANNLKKLDLSNNTKLTELNCSGDNLTSLDLSKNTNLNILYCYDNNLKELDLSNNTKLTELNCSGDNLTSLKLGKNTNLTQLDCNENKLTSLDLSKNTNLFQFICKNNKLTSLDLSKNTNLGRLYCDENNLTSLDLSNNSNLTQLSCSRQKYDITVNRDTREFKYSGFPEGFNKEKVTSPDGASFGDDVLTVDSDDPNVVTYNYKVNDNKEMDVVLNVTYKEFDPEHVESMVVKEQPKLSYTEGEKLDLSGLVVTLTDNQGLTKDVAFKDFKANGITANPENGTELKPEHSGKPVTLTKGNLKAETANLTVNKKVFDPEHVEKMVVKEQPTKLIYTEGEKLDLSGLEVTLTDKQGLTKDVAFKDFKANGITANPENGTELKPEHSGKPVTLTKINLTAETNTVAANNEKTVKLTKVLLTAGKNTLTAGKNTLTAEKNPLTAETNALTVNKKVTPSPTPTPQDPPVVGPVDPTDPAVDPKDPPVDPKDPAVDPKDPPVDPKDPPVNPTQPGGKPQVANNKALPKTASSMNIELYTIFMILSGALLVVAFKRKKESQ